MNGVRIRKMLMGLVGLMLIVAAWPATNSLAENKTTNDAALTAHILSTTLQIKVYAPKPGAQTTSGPRPYLLAQGLGTLANWQGEPVIVTHNHWGALLAEAEFVHILDAQGEIVLELGGEDFRALIRYQDAGTLILTDPQCLRGACSTTLAEIGDSQSIPPGETILIVHQALDGSVRVELMSAQVIALAQYKGLTVFKVRSLDGQAIQSGDSGGGMWHNGQLIGNLWGRFTEATGEAGYAARLSQ